MSYRPDTVPLQEAMGPPYPAPAQFQYTRLEVQREMPKDHFIWSLLCFSYFNPCCLGLAALVHSIKARDRKVMGDVEGARSYGSTARTLNIISTVLFCFIIITFIILTVVLFDQVMRMIYSLQESGNRYGNSAFGG